MKKIIFGTEKHFKNPNVFKNNVTRKTLFRFITSTIITSLLALSAFAHGTGSGFLLVSDDTFIFVGSTVEARFEMMDLYSDAPSTLTGNIFNEIIAKTKKTQKFRVIGMATYPTFKGSNAVWVNLEEIDENDSVNSDSAKKAYWAFMGYQNNDEVENWNFSNSQ